MEYAFELSDGRWLHKPIQNFTDEGHARQWAAHAGIIYKGRFRAPRLHPNAFGTAEWCETCGDNF